MWQGKASGLLRPVVSRLIRCVEIPPKIEIRQGKARQGKASEILNERVARDWGGEYYIFFAAYLQCVARVFN
jgi:hypothetical protein